MNCNANANFSIPNKPCCLGHTYIHRKMNDESFFCEKKFPTAQNVYVIVWSENNIHNTAHTYKQ